MRSPTEASIYICCLCGNRMTTTEFVQNILHFWLNWKTRDMTLLLIFLAAEFLIFACKIYLSGLDHQEILYTPIWRWEYSKINRRVHVGLTYSMSTSFKKAVLHFVINFIHFKPRENNVIGPGKNVLMKQFLNGMSEVRENIWSISVRTKIKRCAFCIWYSNTGVQFNHRMIMTVAVGGGGRCYNIFG